ncbi:MAG TPA: TolC family protein [Fibrobacteria bacterium]|nr:TolC family protein [Fibrobacteria bacterium]HOX51145.1 TolC family protein [Fibrobacteria bacterium]
MTSPSVSSAFLTLSLSCLAGASEKSLQQAIVQLENGNLALKAQSRKAETATEQKLAARGNFLPVVRLDVGLTHLDRDIVLDMDPIRDAMVQLQTSDAVSLSKLDYAMKNPTSPAMPAAAQMAVKNGAAAQLNTALPHFVKTSKEQDDWEAAVVAYQPLFHGGRILAAQRVAGSREKAAMADLARQTNDLRRDFTKLYLQASLLRSSIALRNESIGAIEHHRLRARTMVEQGMADRAALLRAEMTLAEARTSLSDDSAKLESIALTLAQMAGSDEPITPSDTLRPPPSPPPQEGLEERIEGQNPLLASLAAQQELARRAIDVKTADFLPEIGAFGKYELNQDAAKAAMAPCWVVGVKGSVNLFRGGGDWYGRMAARSTELEVAALRNEARNALVAQSKRQFLSCKQSRTRWLNLRSQAELARENHRVVSMRFEQGLATSLEVVDAWLAMQKADLDRVAAAGDAWISMQEILWAAGRTDEFVNLWNGAGK